MRLPLVWRVGLVYGVMALILWVPASVKGTEKKAVQAVAQEAEKYIQRSERKVETKHRADEIKYLEGRPRRIVIPSLGIDIEIVEGRFSSKTGWSIDQTRANFATSTAINNNRTGKTVIYGHDTAKVFRPLKNLTPGSEVYIFTDNNHVFKYVFSSYQITKPTATSIIANASNEPTGLTLITCTGTWSELRYVLNLTYKGAR